MTLALSGSLSGSLWLAVRLSLAHSSSLWLTLAPSGSLWLPLALCLALSGSIWLSQALSGSLRLSLALRICLQSPCLAHKALARLVASLLRYSTLTVLNTVLACFNSVKHVKIRHFLSKKILIPRYEPKEMANLLCEPTPHFTPLCSMLPLTCYSLKLVKFEKSTISITSGLLAFPRGG